MAPPDDDKPKAELKVKQLLERQRGDQPLDEVVDAVTAAELQKWFGLPSFTELEERGEPAPEDPEMVAVRERREKALAAIDPAMLEAHRRRTEPPEDLFTFQATIKPVIDPSVALLDLAMIERGFQLGEPREVEISEELREDLHDCTPQALLRDLHRPELEFEKQFEVIDVAAEQRVDIVAEVASAMRTSLKLPPLGASPLREANKAIVDLRAQRKTSWPAMFLAQPLPNRRVQE